MKKLYVFFVIIPALSYSQWFPQNHIQKLISYGEIDFVNNQTGWMIADSGIIVKTTNGGINWIEQVVDTEKQLYSIEFINSSTGFVAKQYDSVVYKTINSGVNWQEIHFPYRATIDDIIFVNPLTGWMVAGQYLYKSTNSGNNWFIQINDTVNFYFSGNFLNELTGWLCTYPNSYRIIKTTNGGSNWFPINYQLSYIPIELLFINENTGWFINEISNGLYRTSNGGINFDFQLISVRDIEFINQTTGFAIGAEEIFKTTNTGINWLKMYSIAGYSYIYNIKPINYDTLLINGWPGLIYKSYNGGNNWINYSPEISMTLNSVGFWDNMNGWICGDVGTFLKTTNSGVNWVNVQTGTINYLRNPQFLNSSTGWIPSSMGFVLKTTNGGYNWTPLYTGSSLFVYSVSFINANTGWIATDSAKIKKTTNGGLNWFTQYSITDRHFHKIIAVNADRIFCIGYDSVFIKSTNGGLTWQNADTMYGYYYGDIYFLNQNTGWVTSFNLNYILKTTNSGDSWQRYGNDSAYYFSYDLRFLNEFTGFRTNSMPRKTTNGGINWFSLPLPINSFMSASYFVNENTGWTVGQYGNIYKTTNGGAIGITPVGNIIPKAYMLYQNYPNPFNPSTVISFQLSVFSEVKLIVYNTLGQEVMTLVNEPLKPGTYKIEWDASNYPSGTYFYTLTTDGYRNTKTMILLK